MRRATPICCRLSYTGKKTTHSTARVGTFDAQEAVVGRAAWLAVNQPDVKWLVDGHITDVFKLPDAAANTSTANVFSFSNGPELAVDASQDRQYRQYRCQAGRASSALKPPPTMTGFYAQGGWFRYEIERRTALPSPHFTGWYALR